MLFEALIVERRVEVDERGRRANGLDSQGLGFAMQSMVS